MKLTNKRIYYLILKYTILIVLGINLWLFYFVFKPLTIYSVFFLLSLFFDVSLSGIALTFKGFSIQLVKACIAGSAYYLLLILNLTTPMQLKKRLIAVLFSLFLFLAINIFRIFLFSILLVFYFSIFNLTHLLFWYFLSAIIVFLVWLIEIKIFNIKKIPVYSDLKFLYKLVKKTKNS